LNIENEANLSFSIFHFQFSILIWRSGMIRYLRLWRQFVITAFMREAEYRMNFVIGVGEGLAQLALAVISFLLLYRFTDQVAGWTQAEVLMLVGIYRIVDGLINMQIAPNMEAISGYIRRGEMDFILLRPVSSQFLVSLRLLALPESVNVLIGVLLLLYASGAAGVRWSAAGVVAAGAFLLSGLLLLYALWLFLVTFAFWLVQIDNLDNFFYSLFETARYPVVFFKGLLRTLLTFVFPVAFATTFPAAALRGQADLRLLPVGFALAAAALLGTHLFWNYAVRHYSSASS
jgi:ABC-2 type transport system permease protein